MPYSVLGPGMLNAIDEAAKLVKREARIVPGSVKVVGNTCFTAQLYCLTKFHPCTSHLSLIQHHH